MEFKRNEATINRPEGDRVLDGTYVFVDIPSYVRQLKDEKAWEKNDRNGITVFKSSSITIVITALQEGAAIMNNSVDGFLTIQILSGKAKISTADGDIDAVEHQMIALHPGVEHSFVAQTDVVVLLTTYDNEEE
jgi:quercetin dioxygenase-like cupin family protein